VTQDYYLGKFTLFGLTLENFCDKGLQIHGRTLIECTPDSHASNIAKEVGAMKERFFPEERPIVIDLFAGSGNLLFHTANAVKAAKAYGFEMHKGVFKQTSLNFKAMNFQCELAN
jgi:tRNA/tmRNA/rRNA uracil-C5-methylase (TrmA/RlmC/RlmD family)